MHYWYIPSFIGVHNMVRRTTISLPDDLADELDKRDNLNVSGVCQEALRRELERRRELDRLGAADFEDVVLEIDGEAGPMLVSFAGKEVCERHLDADETVATVYLTRRRRIAIVVAGRYGNTLRHYDDLDAAGSDGVESDWLANIALNLGEHRPLVLDI